MSTVGKILFFTCKKMKFISLSHHVIFFLLYRHRCFTDRLHKQTSRIFTVIYCEKAGSDVNNILTSEKIENRPLGSQMYFCMNFTSGVFFSKTNVSI